jgi:hypothetical protein
MVEGLVGVDQACIAIIAFAGERFRAQRRTLPFDQPLHHALKKRAVPLPVPGRSKKVTPSSLAPSRSR